MSSQSEVPPAGGAWQRSGCGPFRGWRPAELLAMVAGFAVWWPLGLAVLAYKFAQGKGYPMPDIVDAARARFGQFASGFGPEQRKRWRPFDSSGNAAFDEWRATELDKLEEQRRKLAEAEKEFAEHMDTLRRARDRDEFERFMHARRNAAQS